jgi:hypothetical protein
MVWYTGEEKAGVLRWDRHGREEEYPSGVVVGIVCTSETMVII